MSYTPFDKPIESIDVADLKVLLDRKVSEGYFVEFKSDFPSNEKIAHAVVAFANTVGGWLIVGVKTNKHNEAEEICGFGLTACHDPTALVRDVIRNHIDPIPLFASRVIELGGGKAVFLLEVPEGQDTPFITKNGRIYRRISDSKEPIAEANRHGLDELIARGKEYNRVFKKFCEDERPAYRDDPGWINLYLVPYPSGAINIASEMYPDDYIAKHLALCANPSLDGESKSGFGYVRFGVGQHHHLSVVFRDVTSLRTATKSSALEFFAYGAGKLFIPVYGQEIVEFIKRFDDGSANASRLSKDTIVRHLDDYPDTGIAWLRFFDFSETMISIGAMLNNYRMLLGSKNLAGEFRLAVEIRNVSRFVPFIDTDEWAEFVSKCGLPSFQHEDAKLFMKGKYLISLENPWESWKLMGEWLAQAFGLPVQLGKSACLRGYEQVVDRMASSTRPA